jgi:2-iminobutanoate/2-iminopropanoate deaminase
MNRTLIHTAEAPEPVGPYQQAVRCNELVFTAGQIPVAPADGHLPEGIEAQTRQALDNLMAVLRAAGSGADRVLKTTVYMIDLQEFPVMNRVYGGYFPEANAPARSTVQVSALPKGARIEIEAIATTGK